jgi:hypothetical protein
MGFLAPPGGPVTPGATGRGAPPEHRLTDESGPPAVPDLLERVVWRLAEKDFVRLLDAADERVSVHVEEQPLPRLVARRWRRDARGTLGRFGGLRRLPWGWRSIEDLAVELQAQRTGAFPCLAQELVAPALARELLYKCGNSPTPGLQSGDYAAG